MLYKIIDLESEKVYLFSDKGFLEMIGVKEKTFNNRWRLKATLGIVFGAKWYIKEAEIWRQEI